MGHSGMRGVSPAELADYKTGYESDSLRRAMAGALYQTDLNKLLRGPEAAREAAFKFSIDIKTMKAADQQSSGRCWLFAATNVLREHLAKALNVEQFELSQSYLAFWDKFERCNYFFEAVLETAGLPLTDRTVNYILTDGGVSDGGQWDMFAALVRKYGVVPKDAMPETYQSSHTGSMNSVLRRYLHKNALGLRRLAESGASAEELEARKRVLLGKCWAFLASCYGQPPAAFDFEYVDKEKAYHRDEGMTPLSFRDKYIGDFLDDCVSVINAPTADKPYDRIYTVKYLGNVAEDRGLRHLNLPMEELKAAVLRQLEAGEIVWFGSDCGKYGDREAGVWDDASFQVELVTGLDEDMDKADMLDSCESRMNHAMCLTGVNIGPGRRPNRWKIENSWGTERGHEGYYVASDSWFDRFVYQAVVHKKYLGEKAAMFDTEPVVLDPWDPIGSLAD